MKAKLEKMIIELESLKHSIEGPSRNDELRESIGELEYEYRMEKAHLLQITIDEINKIIEGE